MRLVPWAALEGAEGLQLCSIVISTALRTVKQNQHDLRVLHFMQGFVGDDVAAMKVYNLTASALQIFLAEAAAYIKLRQHGQQHHTAPGAWSAAA